MSGGSERGQCSPVSVHEDSVVDVTVRKQALRNLPTQFRALDPHDKARAPSQGHRRNAAPTPKVKSYRGGAVEARVLREARVNCVQRAQRVLCLERERERERYLKRERER
jgi:hypothetical protein